MNVDGLSSRARNTLQAARSYAADLKSRRILPAHITVALIADSKGVVSSALQKLGVDPARLSRRIHDELARQMRGTGEPIWDGSVDTLLSESRRIARKRREPLVRTHHLLLALFAEEWDIARRVLQDAGVSSTGLDYVLREMSDEIRKEGAAPSIAGADAGEGKKRSMTESSAAPGRADAKAFSLEGLETLSEFGRDLTGLARDGQLDPIIGRDEEMRRLMQILNRRSKNNPILVGEPGVGKSSIIEGFAQRIASGGVPESLRNKCVVQLDMASLVAGTSLRGQFEERIRKLVAEVASTQGRVLLFVDEIHTMVTTGGRGDSGGAAALLKPALARGEISLLGTTTPAEYRKYIESDKALERRFQELEVGAPSIDESIAILKGIKHRYERHHHVRIHDSAVEAAVRLSDRYVLDRNLPDKAIDLIDEAASVLRLEVESQPARVAEFKERIMSLEGALSGASGEEKTRVQKELEAAREELREFEDRLAHEKEVADRLTRLQSELEATHQLVERAQAEADMGRAAELKYGVAKEIERELEVVREESRQIHEAGPLLREEVNDQDVASVVASWTGIPVNRMLESERKKLLEIEERLGARVVGQEPAVKAIAAAVRRSRAGVQSGSRPIGNFFFVGPTGVGKTELAKALAEFLFDSEESLIRIDMSEYMEQSKVNTLIGAAYGYVDSDKGGVLTEAVRRRPYSVVLFDEAEKAHPDVFNILLQVLDEGRLSDSQGRLVDFTNTIIIMTSNVGAREILDLTGTVPYEELDKRVHEILQDSFKPEFLNRLDDTVVFNALDRDALALIVRILIKKLRKLLLQQEITLEFTQSAIEHLIDVGYQPEYGARPLKRALLTEVQDPLALLLLEERFGTGDAVLVDAAERAEKLSFRRQNER